MNFTYHLIWVSHLQIVHCLNDIPMIFFILKSRVSLSHHFSHIFAVKIPLSIHQLLTFDIGLLDNKRILLIIDILILFLHPGNSRIFSLLLQLQLFLNHIPLLLTHTGSIDPLILRNLTEFEDMGLYFGSLVKWTGIVIGILLKMVVEWVTFAVVGAIGLHIVIFIWIECYNYRLYQ